MAQPIAPRGQQRRECSGRTPERSRDVVVGWVTLEVQGDGKLGLRRPRFFPGVTGGLACAKDLRRSRWGCCGGPTSSDGGFSPLKKPRHGTNSRGQLRLHGAHLTSTNRCKNSTKRKVNFRSRSKKKLFLLHFFGEFVFSSKL